LRTHARRQSGEHPPLFRAREITCVPARIARANKIGRLRRDDDIETSPEERSL